MHRPSELRSNLRAAATRERAVHQLLRETVVIVGDTSWRPVEVETYVHTEGHADPYVHCDPRQAAEGWYVHRRGGTLKNGTFKGLDLTFGAAGFFGGVLMRAVESDGRLVVGPCNVVHAWMQVLGCDHVREFDARIDELGLQAAAPQTGPIYTCRRVGLGAGPESWRLARQRYLTRPRAIKKGRPELLDALIEDGLSTQAIRALTGSPNATINKRRSSCN
ncbi:MAG: hypothetical protein AB8H79_22270 [Myxococcota bacterium]